MVFMSNESDPIRCCWPMYSGSDSGRILSARGAAFWKCACLVRFLLDSTRSAWFSMRGEGPSSSSSRGWVDAWFLFEACVNTGARGEEGGPLLTESFFSLIREEEAGVGLELPGCTEPSTTCFLHPLSICSLMERESTPLEQIGLHWQPIRNYPGHLRH